MKKKSKSPYKQGVFKPLDPSKYTGTYPIVYRSGLELTFFRWCDKNPKIVEWGSESVILPYISPKDGKTHKYFVDGNLKLQTEGGVKKYLIEVKPKSQTMAPKSHGNKKRSTILYEQVQWAVNQAKWESASGWCKKNGYQFAILTEKDLR
jgi:hypothetical protein